MQIDLTNIHIGWPEGIWLTMALLGLCIHAVEHGEPLKIPKYSFPIRFCQFIVSFIILFLGGFFA